MVPFVTPFGAVALPQTAAPVPAEPLPAAPVPAAPVPATPVPAVPVPAAPLPVVPAAPGATDPVAPVQPKGDRTNSAIRTGHLCRVARSGMEHLRFGDSTPGGARRLIHGRVTHTETGFVGGRAHVPPAPVHVSMPRQSLLL